MIRHDEIHSCHDLKIGEEIDLPRETFVILRHPHRNGGYGVWSVTHKQWLFGGIEMNKKSLRCVQHWVLRELGLPSVTHTDCINCGADCEVELVTGFGDAEIERYVAPCRICRCDNAFQVDHRIPMSDEEFLDVMDEYDEPDHLRFWEEFNGPYEED